MHKTLLGAGLLAAALLIFCGSPAVLADDDPNMGVRCISYPSENLNLDAGTLECWFKFVGETTDDPTLVLTMFSLGGQEGGLTATYTWYGKPDAPGMWHLRPAAKSSPLATVGPEYKTDTWYHFAFTWSGAEWTLYLDGKTVSCGKGRVSKMTQPVTFADCIGKLTGKSVCGGSQLHFASAKTRLVVIDDLRVSTVARPPEELGFAVGELKADASTAILDNFETEFEPVGV